MIRIAALLLSVVLLCGACSCAASDELNFVQLDAEVMIGNVIVMINSEEEIFRDEIDSEDIETYVRYYGDAEEKPVELVNVTFRSAQKIGINFHLNKDIDNSTHGADPLYYYLNASATFRAIVSE